MTLLYTGYPSRAQDAQVAITCLSVMSNIHSVQQLWRQATVKRAHQSQPARVFQHDAHGLSNEVSEDHDSYQEVASIHDLMRVWHDVAIACT
jgi:hypothetical protein